MAKLLAAAIIGFIALYGTAVTTVTRPRAGLVSGHDYPQGVDLGFAQLFPKWDKPDLAIVFSGEAHGHLQPCGCSEPQKGGLARRYNFIERLKKIKGWPVAAVELGDMAQRQGPQRLLKYRTYMEGLKLMPYQAAGIGKNEVDLRLLTTLAEYSLNNKLPRIVTANLQERDTSYADMVGSSTAFSASGSKVKVAVIGILSDRTAKECQDPDAKFDPEDKAIPAALAALKEKPDLLVLLYNGSLEDAKACANAHQQFHLIICRGTEDQPSSRADRGGPTQSTMIASVGHKGKHVGVVGATLMPDGASVKLQYQLVELDPEYETPAGKDAENPIHALLQRYADEVRRDNYLAKYPSDQTHEVQIQLPGSKYVGSERCQSCHESAFSIWSDSRHSHAYDTLVTKANRPNQRQYDGECVQCHVTGFTYSTGFRNEQATPRLKDVGCESCHGPASFHSNSPDEKSYRIAINPWKYRAKNAQALELAIDNMCQKCHDQDNSVHFKFKEYWTDKKIAHPKK